MLLKLDGIGFGSSLLTKLPGVVHGFSGRNVGDMRRDRNNRDRFRQMLGLAHAPVFAQQTHGNAIPGDGLVSNTNPVAVLTADCVPLLLVDPNARVCAAVHAGWKGTLGGIAGNAVRAMTHLGADTKRIYVAIGPHIAACCYDVRQERVEAFTKQFGGDEKMAFTQRGIWHLDIGWVNYRQLIDAGISPDYIDAPPTCTSCQNDTFFSYRKDKKETYGEMMAVIGLNA